MSSIGITQKPSWQTVPEQAGPHCASVMHGVRQMASTHIRPVGQYAFAVHWGTVLTSGRQRPSTQASAGFAHSAFVIQPWWQKPLMHAWSAGQSAR
jgi:hypothetical protein